MHTYKIVPFATRNGKAHACDIFHVFCGKPNLIATTRRYATYPAGVRAMDEAKATAKRHAASLNVLPENTRIVIA